MVTTNAGLGYDTNVYNTPSTSYVDLAKKAAPTVVPNVQSGLFVPLDVKADFKVSDSVQAQFKYNGNFYIGSALSNANTSNTQVSLSKEGKLSGMDYNAGVFAGTHTKKYIDHDTGAEKISTVSGVSLANRYNYRDVGIEGELNKKIGRMKVSAHAKVASLTYDDPVAVSVYDHSLLSFGGDVKFPVLDKKVKIKLSYDYKNRDYSKRLARDANAKILTTNDFLNYTYNDFGVQASYAVNKQLRLFGDVIYTTRKDAYVGYNDYTKNTYKLRASYKYSDDIKLRGKFAYSSIDYTNAFAFENATAGIKSSNKTQLSLKGEQQMKGWGDPVAWCELDYRNNQNNDTRYEYVETQVAVGGEWVF